MAHHISLVMSSILLLACVEPSPTISDTQQTSVLEENPFELMSDFNRDKQYFTTDTFLLEDFSSEGGEVITYRADNKDYYVIDVWIYGEMGKLNNTYFSNKTNDIKLAKIHQYRYDQPFTAPTLTMDTSIYYMIYKPVTTIYNKDKIQLTDTTEIATVKESTKVLFTEATRVISAPKP